jgi:predicted Zn finger-like uncharacterized protein
MPVQALRAPAHYQHAGRFLPSQYWCNVADSDDNQVTVSGEQEYAFYTRYPDIGKSLWPKEAYDLECPKCGAQEIVLIRESPVPGKAMLGDLVRCWMCKHEFNVTENCWKWRKIGTAAGLS